jgi:hypothetical protein
MRAPDGDKIIIERDADGHFVFSRCTGMVTAGQSSISYSTAGA